jgi:TPR repeat protein
MTYAKLSGSLLACDETSPETTLIRSFQVERQRWPTGRGVWLVAITFVSAATFAAYLSLPVWISAFTREGSPRPEISRTETSAAKPEASKATPDGSFRITSLDTPVAEPEAASKRLGGAGEFPPAIDAVATIAAAPAELAATGPEALASSRNVPIHTSAAQWVEAAPVVTAPCPCQIEKAALTVSAAALVARGDRFWGLGDVATARLFYERAVDAGDGQAALRLGKTFDPAFLEQAHLHHVQADTDMALSWYRRAREFGVGEAEELLKQAASK